MEMSQEKPGSGRNKWLMGCGIGCGALVVITVILAVAGFFFFKDIIRGFKESDETMKLLTAKYGMVSDYRPDPAGPIGAGRLEVFLSARDAALPVRRVLEESFTALSGAKRGGDIEVGSSGGAFSKIKQAMGIVPRIAEYFKARNRGLLDSGMGIGEYAYIYVTAYYGWLKKPVTDGPGFRIGRGDSDKEDPTWDRRDGREYHKEMILRWIQSFYLPMLKNQAAGLTKESGGPAPGSAAAESGARWGDALAAEIKALESDPLRVPWQDGMPDVLAASLEPFRRRLEASYSPMINPLETVVEQK